MVICKKCKSSGKQGEVFFVESFEEGLENAICSNCIQPERSKREDSIKDCDEIGHMYTWMPKNQSLCMRCGALNSMET